MGKYYAVARGMNPGIYQSLVSRQYMKIHAFIHCSKRLNYDVIVTLWKIDTILNIQSEVEAQTIGYKDTLGGAKVKECRTLKEAEVR